ncbi:hypothetical protein AWC22_23670 [Mycobacterium riyadhense]|uniref:Uncharacterized protein n=1 Tax=Mycobacterium riyadhense TaxID=486698 RepID=A0A1X2CE92_9MYCO|nr:hypothetical protein AWC22_23670 [Mycobacterium riyadhense]
MDEHIHDGAALVIGWLLGSLKLGEEVGVTARQFFHDNDTMFRWNSVENIAHGFLHPLRLFAQAVTTFPSLFKTTTASFPSYS